MEESAKFHFSGYQTMKDKYEQHREKNTPASHLDGIIGTYYNDSIRMTIDVFEVEDGLAMKLNGRESQRHNLTHYHHDVFGFLPASREEQQLRCLVDYFVYEQFLIFFHFEEGKAIAEALSWKMQDDFPPLRFPGKNRCSPGSGESGLEDTTQA